MICAYCGFKKVDPTDIFCPKCGAEFKTQYTGPLEGSEEKKRD